MNNKVFYQHPNLMRALGMHETVMEVMVNVLGGGGDSKVRMVVRFLYSMPVMSWFLVGSSGFSCTDVTMFLFFSSRRSDSPRW